VCLTVSYMSYISIIRNTLGCLALKKKLQTSNSAFHVISQYWQLLCLYNMKKSVCITGGKTLTGENRSTHRKNYTNAIFTVAPCISKIHLSLQTKLIYYLNSVLIIHIKTLYSFVTPTCFDTLCVIIREHTFFLAKITD
jgi:hypothetical protein